MKNKNTWLKLVSLLCFMLVALPAFSQMDGIGEETIDEIPIDGGISLIVAGIIGAGAAAMKKIKGEDGSK